MSLFNTQRKASGNATAGEAKLAPKAVKAKAPKETKAKAIVVPKAEKKAEEKTKNANEKRAEAAHGVSFPKGGAIVKPRVTEKAGLLSEKGIYVFDVRIDANIKQIAAAITEAYKVTPTKINVAAVKSKAMFVRGKKGKTVAGKKAYVFLKKGDTIEFV
jgi:large subunit ribosomal protein L23